MPSPDLIAKTPFWSLSPEKTLETLRSREEGLSEEEAAERLAQFGKNTIKDGGIRKTKILWNQLQSPLILILCAAGAITAFLDHAVDSVFIFAAVLINAAIGFFQEYKAETILESLKSYIRERARVIRNGNEEEKDAEEIVPGDIVRLRGGTRVPADMRLISITDLEVDEAIITGESLPIAKKTKGVPEEAALADRHSMLHGGTLITEGVGIGVVVKTGNESELGRIAAMVRKEESKTPLQEAIRTFSLRATIVLLLFVGTLFIIGTWKGLGYFEMFFISVAIAVSAVPEGLPIAMTVILAVGVERLAKRKGVVRQLLAAETLGRTTVIMTDKTGTLTEGKMELVKIISKGEKEDVLSYAMIALNLHKKRLAENPLEEAVLRAGEKLKTLLPREPKNTELVEYKPFNSRDKWSGVCLVEGREKIWVRIGAPEIITALIGAKPAEKEEIHKETEQYAREGGRVLGVTKGNLFLGLLILKDPARKGMKEIIEKTKEAGMKVVIVTGDHKGTAISIGKEVGIDAHDGEIVTGEELQKMNDVELALRLPDIKIFARISPEDKLRLAKIYKKEGEIVAMTGDGVNDAPALKAADIGVAVGSGTDVAKGAADLIILDNNFETIIAAVEEGRRILGNIKKVIIYLLSDSLNELFLIGGSIVIGLPMPLNALQILWVNFFSDSFPAVAFAFEKGGDHLKKEMSAGKNIFDSQMKFLILVIGGITSALLFVIYYAMLRMGFDESLTQSFIFATFASYTLLFALALRRLETSIFKYNPLGNPYLFGGIGIGILLIFAALYLPPLQAILKTTPLPPIWLLGVLGFSAINILAVEATKFFFRKK